jgi:hypothetical protein
VAVFAAIPTAIFVGGDGGRQVRQITGRPTCRYAYALFALPGAALHACLIIFI